MGKLCWLYYANLKNYAKSIEASQKALEIDDKDIFSRCNLAIALLHIGQYKEAKKEYYKVIKLIRSDKYSVTAECGQEKPKLLEKCGLEDLYDARKVTSGELLEQINELIEFLEYEKRDL